MRVSARCGYQPPAHRTLWARCGYQPPAHRTLWARCGYQGAGISRPRTGHSGPGAGISRTLWARCGYQPPAHRTLWARCGYQPPAHRTLPSGPRTPLPPPAPLRFAKPLQPTSQPAQSTTTVNPCPISPNARPFIHSPSLSPSFSDRRIRVTIHRQACEQR